MYPLAVVVSELVISRSVSQLSANVGAEIGASSPQSKVIAGGTFDATGASLSSNINCCSHEEELPQSSVAVHVLTITTGHTPEGAASENTMEKSEQSVADASPDSVGEGTASAQSKVTSEGQEIIGASVSTIVIF